MAAKAMVRKGDRVEHKRSRKAGIVLQDLPAAGDRILVRWDIAYNASGQANAWIKINRLRKVAA